MIPVFRGSEIDTFSYCPYSYVASLVARVGTDGLADYLCEAGRQWAMEHVPPACSPVPKQNWLTAQGLAFHRFAHAYGLACRERGLSTMPHLAEEMAVGFATIEGRVRNDLREMMVGFAHTWEYPADQEEDADKSIPLTSGGFEQTERIKMQSASGEFYYSFHPDYAHLRGDLTAGEGDLIICDWKSGLAADDYSPERPDPQLLRYAYAYSHMYYPRRARMEKWWVNPENPAYHESPFVWVRDLKEKPIDSSIISGPVEAIRRSPEFRPSAGKHCGFCEFGHICPIATEVEGVVGRPLTEALQAFEALEEVRAMRGALSAKAKACRAVISGYLDEHGKIDLPDGSVYRRKSVLLATVNNWHEFVESCKQAAVNPWEHVEQKDKRALAELLDLLAEGNDPFANTENWQEGIKLEGVRLNLSIQDGVFASPDDETIPEPYMDDATPLEGKPLPGNAAERLKQRAEKRESTHTFAPEVDQTFAGLEG